MCCYTETQDDSDGSLEGAGFLCNTRMWGDVGKREQKCQSVTLEGKDGPKPEEGSLGNRGGQEETNSQNTTAIAKWERTGAGGSSRLTREAVQ